MSDFSSVEAISNEFAISGNFKEGQEIDSGLINSTFLACFIKPNGIEKRYIFQRINENVFPKPTEVMQNVERVTRHINWKVLRVKKDLGGQTLNLYPARGGNFYTRGESGGIWRCYNFIEGCKTYDECNDKKIAYQAAKAFGSFLDLVSDFPADEIHETLVDFHHTKRRFEQLQKAIAEDAKGRVSKVAKEIAFINEREAFCSKFIDLQEAGILQTRVTHNDTKINNVMMDEELDVAVCVIDLDTVMPGLALYDFGDLVRTAVSAHEEDAKDLSTVKFRTDFFEALAQGYLDGCEALSPAEIENMPFAGKMMALEVGIRFLTDYLEGDHYFRTTREDQNLDRCRTQLKLVQELENNETTSIAFIAKTAEALNKGKVSQ